MSLTALNKLLHDDLKNTGPMSGTWAEPRHTAVRILKKTGYRIAFLSKKATQSFLFCLNGFGFINFESQESEFPMVFNMFVNMFWIAEGFDYKGMPFKHWPVNNFCLIFSLVLQKQIFVDKSKKKDFFLRSPSVKGFKIF